MILYPSDEIAVHKSGNYPSMDNAADVWIIFWV